MQNVSKEIANYLLQIKAIKLQPANPFTWASGWKSPIYCDNRKTLSYPDVRTSIKNAFVQQIKALYPDADIIAGVATGAIAQGALVADAMGLPNIYIRSSAKGHGMENLIEGYYEKGNKVVVIEDLVSTGGSSLKAVEALKKAGCEVLGMMAIFTYGFDVAVQNFETANIQLHTLSDYQSLLEQALEINYIQESDVETLGKWRENPSVWGVE